MLKIFSNHSHNLFKNLFFFSFNPRFSNNEVTETLMQDFSGFSEKSFCDRVKIRLIAGEGGNGLMTFHKDRKTKSGQPNGGDGGKGGDIYLKSTYFHKDFHYIKKYSINGNKGKIGRTQNKDGKCGKDLYYSVPVGTLVSEILSNKKMDSHENYKKKDYYKKLIADLDVEGKIIKISKGGKGGHGNGKHPTIIQPGLGEKGQAKDLFLELKSIADIGLVGFPNAGKSSLLASISRSLPKIANYPFTTLTPIIGKVKFLDNFDFLVADIPGIIEGAHINKGLGLEFLRHIERTKILCYVIDISSTEAPEKELETLQNELYNYDKEFLKRPSLIVANKVDLEKECEKKLEKLKKFTNHEIVLASAKHNFKMGEVVLKLRKLLENNI